MKCHLERNCNDISDIRTSRPSTEICFSCSSLNILQDQPGDNFSITTYILKSIKYSQHWFPLQTHVHFDAIMSDNQMLNGKDSYTEFLIIIAWYLSCQPPLCTMSSILPVAGRTSKKVPKELVQCPGYMVCKCKSCICMALQTAQRLYDYRQGPRGRKQLRRVGFSILLHFTEILEDIWKIYCPT